MARLGAAHPRALAYTATRRSLAPPIPAGPAAMLVKSLAGIVKYDETIAQWSYKEGSRLADMSVAQARGGAMKGRDSEDEVGVLVMQIGKATLSDAPYTINHQMIDGTGGHRVDRDTVLCTDGAPVYYRYSGA